VARSGVGGRDRGLLGATAVAALVALGGLLSTVAGVGKVGASAVTLAAALLLGVAVPTFAARLAGLRIAPLPTSTAEFQQDIDPEPSRRVLARADLADGYLASLYLGLGAVAAGCLVVLAATPDRPAQALVAVASFVLLAQGRDLTGAWHRLAALGPGLLGAVALLVAQVAAAPTARRLAVVAALVILAGVLVAAARVLPGRQMLPYWGRLADLAQMAAAMAVVPLVLAVLHLYGRVRAGWA
jgi:type VII secretion integral membrane protein EccD